jgi:hypothetical protein
MVIVRYADDLVVGFQHEGDARRFLDALRARFEAFALSLHPGKTRLIVQHGAKRRWITLQSGGGSRSKPAPHHARNRRWITRQTGTSGRGRTAPALGPGSLLAGG